jgi:hypothetical protein
MSPRRTTRTIPNLLAPAWKEIRRMSRNFVRFLDTLSHVTVVFLALYVGGAMAGIGLA